MSKLKLLAAVAIGAMAVSIPAKASILLVNFDDLPGSTDGESGSSVSDGYLNPLLKWSNFSVATAAGTASATGGTGWTAGLKTSPNVGFNTNGNSAQLTTTNTARFQFGIQDAWFAAAYENGLTLQITANRFKKTQLTMNITLNSTTATHIIFPTAWWESVTTLNFVPTDNVAGAGGNDLATPNAGYDGALQTTQFTIDAITLANPIVVPEPATWAGLVSAFAGVGMLARRRKAGAAA